jgi:hypothetical protein
MQIFCWELHGNGDESEKTLSIKLNHYSFSHLIILTTDTTLLYTAKHKTDKQKVIWIILHHLYSSSV